jgi:PAS domain S-box-containing protein
MVPDRTPADARVESIPTREVDAILEKGIRLVRERSEVVLNAVDDGIYVLDHEGHTIFANEAAVRNLGFTLREMLGRPQHALIHHTHVDGSAFPVEECPIYAAAHYGVYQRVGGDVFWHKDGRAIAVDYTSTPIKDGRAVVGAVITFRESAGGPRAASAEPARDQLLAEAIEQAPLPIIVTRGAEHQITHVNERARSLVGERVLNDQSARAALAADDQAELVTCLDRAFETAEPQVVRGVSFAADHEGVVRLADVRLVPVHDGVVMYVTERPRQATESTVRDETRSSDPSAP